jgi:hypothetical protein
MFVPVMFVALSVVTVESGEVNDVRAISVPPTMDVVPLIVFPVIEAKSADCPLRPDWTTSDPLMVPPYDDKYGIGVVEDVPLRLVCNCPEFDKVTSYGKPSWFVRKI